jgi:hypothetical protein
MKCQIDIRTAALPDNRLAPTPTGHSSAIVRHCGADIPCLHGAELWWKSTMWLKLPLITFRTSTAVRRRKPRSGSKPMNFVPPGQD